MDAAGRTNRCDDLWHYFDAGGWRCQCGQQEDWNLIHMDRTWIAREEHEPTHPEGSD